MFLSRKRGCLQAFVRDGDGALFTEFKYCDFLPQDFPRVDNYCTPSALEKVGLNGAA